MKIGILLISDNFAGTENAVYNLAKNFINQGQEVTLFLNHEIIKYYKLIKNLKIINLGRFFSLNLIKRILQIKKIRRNLFNNFNHQESLDSLLVFLEYSYLIINPFYDKTSFKIIPTLRGAEIQEYYSPKGIKGFIIRQLIENSFKKCNNILALTKKQVSFLPEEYKKKTIVIPNGVDSNVFKPLKGIRPQKNIILFTGRFIELKGINEIISVAKQLPQYEFWFAGQGPLANLINLPNTKNLGFKTTEELVRLYNQANICVMPSYWEGFSNVGLEANSCGKAIVATSEGFGEYLEDQKDSLLVPAKDEGLLKQAIEKLMTDKKLRNRLEKNAREKALKHSWEAVAKDYIKELNKSKRNKL